MIEAQWSVWWVDPSSEVPPGLGVRPRSPGALMEYGRVVVWWCGMVACGFGITPVFSQDVSLPLGFVVVVVVEICA